MNKFLERHKLIKQIQEQREYVHRFIISKGIELVIKYIATAHKENPRPDGFTGEFNRTFKVDLILVLLKLFQTNEKQAILPNSFYKSSIILIPKLGKDNTKK